MVKGNRPARGKKVLLLNRTWCKGCGICVAFCPKGVLELDEEEKAFALREDACTSCGLCVVLCPDFAVTLEDRPDGKRDSG